MPQVGIPGRENGNMGKRHLEQPTQEARAKMRKTLGPLKNLTVQPVTRKRYDKALADFFAYLRHERLTLPHQAQHMDAVSSDYLEHLWAKGYGRTEASNFLAALQDSQPHLKGKLAQSWRLLKAWVTHEVPNRAPPLPLDLVEAMAGYALFKNLPLFALSLLLAFYGLLRTGELLAVTVAHVSISRPKGPAVISLGMTKAGKRQGAAESVTIYCEDVCRRLHQWVKTHPAKTSLTGPSHQWRKQFADTLSALSFDKWDFRPYSLRRGGATHQFQLHGAFDRLLVQGRWQSIKTARIYVNEGLSVQAELNIPWTRFSTNLRAQFHKALTTTLPKLEPVTVRSKRPAQSRGRWKRAKKGGNEC